jgi:lipoprotein-releasing system permease protein
MLGVATLIIVMSVMNGFREDLIGRILGINSHISIYSNNLHDSLEAVRIVKENPNVRSANRLIDNQVMIMGYKRNSGAIIRGIDEDDLKNKPQIYNNILSDDFNLQDNKILLGKDLAKQINVSAGSEVKVISPELNSTLVGIIPRIKTYTVVGTFDSGMYEYDNGTAFISLTNAQKHFKYDDDKVGSIEVYLNDINKIDTTYNELANALKSNNYKVVLVDWKKSNASFIGALDVERNVMFIILMLIIIVATFNIISSLTMLVNDKIQQIALLRTMGFSRQSVMRIFFICGSIIGTFGTILGLAVGILFAKNIQSIKIWLERVLDIELFSPSVYYLNQLPSKIIAGDVILITILSLILSFLSTIYPAYKASRTNPAEVLRYQ